MMFGRRGVTVPLPKDYSFKGWRAKDAKAKPHNLARSQQSETREPSLVSTLAKVPSTWMVTAMRMRDIQFNFRGQLWPSPVGFSVQPQPPSQANQLKQRHPSPSFLPQSGGVVARPCPLSICTANSSQLSAREQMSPPVLWAAHNSVSSLASTAQQ